MPLPVRENTYILLVLCLPLQIACSLCVHGGGSFADCDLAVVTCDEAMKILLFYVDTLSLQVLHILGKLTLIDFILDSVFC